jgi:putative transposase
VLCEVLEVGRRGFSAYHRRQAVPALSPEEIPVLERIKAIAAKTNHRYGRRRMTTQLRDEGYDVGRFTVRRLMQQAGVVVQGRRRSRPTTTDSRHGYEVARICWRAPLM